MNDPYKQLASVLSHQMSRQASMALSGLPAELGTVTANGLKLDSLRDELTDYLVAEFAGTLEMPAFSWEATVGGGTRTRFDFEKTMIPEVKLNQALGLQPGDRVLAVPVNGGHDVIVLGKAVSRNG